MMEEGKEDEDSPPMREGVDGGGATEAVAPFSLRLITKKKKKKKKKNEKQEQQAAEGGLFISARKRCVKGSDLRQWQNSPMAK
jgi:hypothetical protein